MALLDDSLRLDPGFGDWLRKRNAPETQMAPVAAPEVAAPQPAQPVQPATSADQPPPQMKADDVYALMNAHRAHGVDAMKQAQEADRLDAIMSGAPAWRTRNLMQQHGMEDKNMEQALSAAKAAPGISKEQLGEYETRQMLGPKVELEKGKAREQAAKSGLEEQKTQAGAMDMEEKQRVRAALQDPNHPATQIVRGFAKEVMPSLSRQIDAASGADLAPYINIMEKMGAVREQNLLKKTLMTDSTMTPEAVEMAARVYVKTGQLPQMGMGAAGAMARRQVLARAAQLVGPDGDVAGNKASYHADSGSLAALQKQMDAVEAFENTAQKNLDQFLDLAKKVPDSKVPLLNRPLRSIDDKLLGSPDMAAFNAARQVAINEVAKVLSNPGLSGVLSDSARHEVEGLIGPDATMAQIIQAANVLKQDMGNRKSAFVSQRDVIKKRLAGGSESPAPSADASKPAAGDSAVVKFKGKTLKIPRSDLAQALKDGAEEVK